MNFTDLATLPGADEKDIKGLRFGTDDGRWMVAASDRAVTEWIIWQRALPGDRRTISKGYVRRVPWMRFVGEHAAEQAMFIASVLDDMPASASLEVFRIAVKDAARDLKTRLMFRAIAKAGELANAARRDVERVEDDLLRD
jgi:hypothetical protein